MKENIKKILKLDTIINTPILQRVQEKLNKKIAGRPVFITSSVNEGETGKISSVNLKIREDNKKIEPFDFNIRVDHPKEGYNKIQKHVSFRAFHLIDTEEIKVEFDFEQFSSIEDEYEKREIENLHDGLFRTTSYDDLKRGYDLNKDKMIAVGHSTRYKEGTGEYAWFKIDGDKNRYIRRVNLKYIKNAEEIVEKTHDNFFNEIDIMEKEELEKNIKAKQERKELIEKVDAQELKDARNNKYDSKQYSNRASI